MHQFHLRWVQNWLVMNTPDAQARPANPSPDEVGSTYRQIQPAETRQQASQAASQQPTPTAAGRVNNSVAGASYSLQSRQSESSAVSDNLEVFLSLILFRGYFSWSLIKKLGLALALSSEGQIVVGPRVC